MVFWSAKTKSFGFAKIKTKSCRSACNNCCRSGIWRRHVTRLCVTDILPWAHVASERLRRRARITSFVIPQRFLRLISDDVVNEPRTWSPTRVEWRAHGYVRKHSNARWTKTIVTCIHCARQVRRIKACWTFHCLCSSTFTPQHINILCCSEILLRRKDLRWRTQQLNYRRRGRKTL